MSEIRKMKEKLTENDRKTNQKMVDFESKYGVVVWSRRVFLGEP